MLNCSRDYRKQRRKRRDEKKAKDGTETSTSPTNSPNPTPNDEFLGSGSDISSQGGDYDNEGSSKSKFEKKNNLQRKGRQRTAKQYRDMYKLFDGSAIMAIGQRYHYLQILSFNF